MSRSHIRKEKKAPQPIVWWHIALGLGVFFAAFLAVVGLINWVHSHRATYETAQGRILEIRKVVDGRRDTSYGGKVLYGIEAHVQYVADGKVQDRWLRASDDLPIESLALKLSAHPTECLVYWTQGHSENARCSLK